MQGLPALQEHHIFGDLLAQDRQGCDRRPGPYHAIHMLQMASPRQIALTHCANETIAQTLFQS